MPISVALAQKLEEIDPQLRSVLLALLDEVERQREESVTKTDFSDLRAIVKDLAEAQNEARQQLTELVAAQKETRVELTELAAAQKETRIQLTELATAHKETRIQLAELAVAQKNTTIQLTELATAQKETEKAIKELATSHKELKIEHAKTRTELGGLSETVGFNLENEAYKFLPALLKKDFGLRLKGNLLRKFVPDSKGEPIELDIIGEATQNTTQFMIVGEAKSQLSKSKVDEFIRKKLRRLQGVFAAEVFPIMVTHMISENDVPDYAQKRGIKRLYYSYEFSDR